MGQSALEVALDRRAHDREQTTAVRAADRAELSEEEQVLTGAVLAQGALEDRDVLRLPGGAARLGVHDGCLRRQGGGPGPILPLDPRAQRLVALYGNAGTVVVVGRDLPEAVLASELGVGVLAHDAPQ